MLNESLQWCAANVEGMLAILTILAALVSLLTKAGVIQKARGEVLTQVLEDSAGVTQRVLDQLASAKKDGTVTNAEIATAVAKGLKGEARERAIKTGLKSVVTAVAQGAARADEKKDDPSIASRIGNVIRSRIPFLDRIRGR